METTTTAMDEFNAPFGKQVAVQQVDYEDGMSFLRLRIREGKRFTILDLDPATAAHWGRLMVNWAERQPTDTPPPRGEGAGPEDTE